MAKIYAGTSGWAYPSWKPDFYPAKLPSAKFLGHYAERLNTVEVNYTFRRFPTEKLLRGWIAATPPEFQFAVKANQKITHISRLKNVADFTSDFLGALEPLATERKLGPVLFQLPPYLKADVALLKDFLATVPRNVRSAFEFRHASWFSDDVYEALREANVALCNAESEKLETPAVQAADFAYLRLRKETYSPAERTLIASTVSDLVKRGDVYVYFKHEDTPEGALNAEQLIAAAKTA
ncbi:MAG TPA: DUF72 domain-containing protein [Candidatus Eisenbacteria bacterium]|nr:DUF72 domain-containing protein [Candidatus Eisenbacteria bacterium]